jgi:hypothetical protein
MFHKLYLKLFFETMFLDAIIAFSMLNYNTYMKFTKFTLDFSSLNTIPTLGSQNLYGLKISNYNTHI